MLKRFLVLSLVIIVLSQLCAVYVLSADSPEQGSRKIVVFKSRVKDNITKDKIVKNAGAEKIKNLDIINGIAVKMTGKTEKMLLQNNSILRIDEDAIVNATAKKTKPPTPPSTPSPTPSPTPAPTPTQNTQVIPWNIIMVEGGSESNSDTVRDTVFPSHAKVAVIDTGISRIHPDLAANIKGGYNAINPAKSPNDDNGHGSHVAGIIAAVDNTIGIAGIHPQIDLYAVKVLNAKGSGYISDIIEGIQWCVDNNIQVANMSFGSNQYVQSFHDAITAAYNAGITLIAAAGNNYLGSVDYPAKYDEVIAVSAVTSGQTIASFSSIGSEVDICAPGQSIFSTYKNSLYKTLSGTSMATPHITGIAAVLILKYGCTPLEVENMLETTATDLGIPGDDIYYGAGLVNAYKALGY